MLAEPNIYTTQNVGLAAFLMMEGEQLLEFSRSDANKKIVVIRFLDKLGKCRDLERVFINSDFKKYIDMNKWLLSRIHEKLREE